MEKYSSLRKVPVRKEHKGFVGSKFNKLLVLEKTSMRYSSNVVYRCLCDCGSETFATMTWLKSGRKKTCGCERFSAMREASREAVTTHGMSKTATYKTWQSMRQRCENPNNDSYSRYGGRGISVCDRWSAFENFLEDMGERPPGKSIDRIDANGDYEPENCRWADNVEQSNNRIKNVVFKVGDKWMTIADASRELGITRSGVMNRVRSGALEKAVAYEIKEKIGK